MKNQNVKITNVVLNKSVPFELNIYRVVIIVLIVLLIHSLRVDKFWQEEYRLKSFNQNFMLMLIIDVGIIIIYFISNNCQFEKNDLYDTGLVRALSKGQVQLLEDDVPDVSKLEKLENPYDSIERDNKLSRNSDYIWDAAYYNQKYYIYFGALPAVLLMVPYHLITNKLATSATITLIFSVLTVPVLVILTRKVFQKYFKELPFKFMALSSIIMVLGTALIWVNVAPRFYELVTVAGFFFATLGFLLIFDCEKEDGSCKYREIFFGALCLALAVGCRPTQLFASLLAVPILLRIFIKNVKNKTNIIKNILVVAIPYIVVGSLIMRYNYVRFGNVFEFGEKYQLTVNNMKSLKLRWINVPTGLMAGLLGLPTFQATFPFLHSNSNIIDTFSYFYVEDMPGGVFFLAPIAFFCFGIVWLWKKSKDKELKIFATSLLTVGLIFATFISLKAGMTGRYLLDFAWLFVLTGIMIFMEIVRSLKTQEGRKILEVIFAVIVIYTVIINILSGFCVIGGINSMRKGSPKAYFNSEYTVMFLK